MIHGYPSEGAFWEKSDHKFIEAFTDKKMLYDNSINLPNRGKESIDRNSSELITKVKEIADKYHVKHIHLVAHSKGGLDSRAYLAKIKGNSELGVLSLITLSTPHHGSALADLVLDTDLVGTTGSFASGQSLAQRVFFLLTNWFRSPDDATKNLRVSHMEGTFNPSNRLPGNLPQQMTVDGEQTSVSYFAFGADANVDGIVSPMPTISDEEAAGSPFAKRYLVGPLSFFGRKGAEATYLFLYKYRETTVEKGIRGGKEVPVLVVPILNGVPKVNDFFVTFDSSKYDGFSQQELERRNHQTLAKPDIAGKVIQLIKSAQP